MKSIRWEERKICMGKTADGPNRPAYNPQAVEVKMAWSHIQKQRQNRAKFN